MKKYLDKHGLIVLMSWIKTNFGRVKTVNNKKPDKFGNVDITVNTAIDESKFAKKNHRHPVNDIDCKVSFLAHYNLFKQ